MGNKTFDFSSKKKGFFAQEGPNLAQNWHFWSIWTRPCWLLRCPVGGSVGGCGAQAVSRKTPIYFISIYGCHGYLQCNNSDKKNHEEICMPQINLGCYICQVLSLQEKQYIKAHVR